MTGTSDIFARPGRVTSMRYVRVSWPDLGERGELTSITGCKLTESQETSLKVSGTLEYRGDTGLGLDDLVRVYSDSEAGGERASACHATLMVSAPSRSIAETGASGEADLYSVLRAMQQRVTGDSTVLAKGASPLALARSLAEGCGLKVVADPSDFVAAGDHAWDAGTDALAIANECLEMCGFASATVDAYGTVLMRRYVAPESRAPAARLTDAAGGQIIGGRIIKEDRDVSEIPNASYVTVSPAEQDAEPVRGSALNTDPASPWSIPSRGREIGTYAEYQELAGDADAKALELLRTAMRVIEKYEVETLWYGLSIGDVVTLDYGRLGVSADCALVRRETEMGPALRSTLTLRRTVDEFAAKRSLTRGAAL